MEKFTQKGAIAGFTGIAFGLMTLFGGVDIPTLIAIVSLWALVIAIKNGAFIDVYKGVFRFPVTIFIFMAALVYLCLTRLHEPEIINQTSRSFIVGAIFLPFLSWAFLPFGQKPNKEDRLMAMRGLIAGFAIAALMLSVEALNGYHLYQMANPQQDPKELERNLGRGAYILTIFLWPTLLAIDAQKLDIKLKIFLVVATIFLSTRFGIDLNMVNLAAAAIAFGLALYLPKLMLAMMSIVPAVLITFAPWIYGFVAHWSKSVWKTGEMPLSYERRADMWIYAIDRIHEKPIWGWGLDSARKFDSPVELGGYEWVAIQMHPHSAPLNLWIEGGVVGVFLFVISILAGGLLLYHFGSKNNKIAATLCGSLTAIIVAWAVSYGAWQQWLWMCLLLAIIYPFMVDGLKQKAKQKDEMFEIA